MIFIARNTSITVVHATLAVLLSICSILEISMHVSILTTMVTLLLSGTVLVSMIFHSSMFMLMARASTLGVTMLRMS